MRKTFRSFTAGELSRDMYARYDVEKYGSGCMILRNYMMLAQGGVYKRPGTYYQATGGDYDAKIRLIPFEFSTIQAYALEFGNLYMRVFTVNGQVLEASKNITNVSQAQPAVVTSNGHGFTNGDEVYIANIGGMTDLNGRNFRIANVTANTFSLKNLDGTAFDTTGMPAYTSGGIVARVYEIDTPFTEDDLFDLYYAQTADIMSIVHPSYAPRELSRTGNTSWTLGLVNFTPPLSAPSNFVISNVIGTGNVRNTYKVTAIDADGKESLASDPSRGTASVSISAITNANPGVLTHASGSFQPGDTVYISGIVGMTELNNRFFTVNTVPAATSMTLRDENGIVDTTAYGTYTSGGSILNCFANVDLQGATGRSVTMTWNPVAGATQYKIYKLKGGVYGFIGTSTGTSFTDDNILPATIDTPPNLRNPFNSTGNYPSVVGFYKQRRVFAATDNKPDTIFMSMAGQYSNMSVSIPSKADDAITFAIASGQVNKINHLVTFRDLLALTAANEWKIFSSSGGLTNATVASETQTNYGSTRLRPIIIGSTAIHASRFGRAIRDTRFTYETEGYDGNDLSILSKHLLADRDIVDWAYAQEPNQTIQAAMSDGAMVGVTYMREHQVWGLGRLDTDGEVESVCSIPDPVNRVDVIFYVVKRIINGQPIRMIEKSARYIDTAPEDGFFVDCGLTYDGTATNTVGGLWHLEGREVRVLADGNVLANKTVVNGRITLDGSYSKIHVGLYYKSELQPMTPEFDQDRYGSSKGMPKRIKSMKAEVINTRALKAGQSPEDEVFSPMVPMFENNDLSNPIQLVTGMVEFSVQTAYDDAYVAPYLFHDDPLPCKIISVTPVYE